MSDRTASGEWTPAVERGLRYACHALELDSSVQLINVDTLKPMGIAPEDLLAARDWLMDQRTQREKE